MTHKKCLLSSLLLFHPFLPLTQQQWAFLNQSPTSSPRMGKLQFLLVGLTSFGTRCVSVSHRQWYSTPTVCLIQDLLDHLSRYFPTIDANSIVVQTNELDICVGRDVDIPPELWPEISPQVRNIKVVSRTCCFLIDAGASWSPTRSNSKAEKSSSVDDPLSSNMQRGNTHCVSPSLCLCFRVDRYYTRVRRDTKW